MTPDQIAELSSRIRSLEQKTRVLRPNSEPELTVLMEGQLVILQVLRSRTDDGTQRRFCFTDRSTDLASSGLQGDPDLRNSVQAMCLCDFIQFGSLLLAAGYIHVVA